MKKIKKVVPEENLLDFIKSENKEDHLKNKTRGIKGAQTRMKNKNMPSKKIEFNRWNKKDIEKWAAADFIGYYLYNFKEVFNEEDIEFKKLSKFGKEKGYVSRCFINLFDSNGDEFKNYIKFIINWWNTEDAFVDGLPSMWSIFTQKPTFVKIYQASKLTSKTKKVVKRKDADNKFAEKESWDNYFDEMEAE